jgi:hypothetical protein
MQAEEARKQAEAEQQQQQQQQQAQQQPSSEGKSEAPVEQAQVFVASILLREHLHTHSNTLPS